MIKVELHSGEILICKGLSSDPMGIAECIIQYDASFQEIKWSQIKHISAC